MTDNFFIIHKGKLQVAGGKAVWGDPILVLAASHLQQKNIWEANVGKKQFWRSQRLCHSRENGNPHWPKEWIPACAGMTTL
ncbi:MAG: hypothetical protein KC423_21215 [Anaerolineales bacterium]|nr:hypothetical protein [Anaerolineales bacterium]